MTELFNNHRFEMGVVIFVLIDCICVLIELFLDLHIGKWSKFEFDVSPNPTII